eukprot:TRINITY_DN4472_c0_g1_i1.p1 TRINITY_DN4472_c0_g1~~TRINITY_DN4472_c0_g1_i1.p1  ORF type:complete len:420 (+),score=64.42 TRINITY_DN4472_c0_g1_i1:1143-2402(+)
MRTKVVDHLEKERVWYSHNGEGWSEVIKRINWISSTVLIATPIMSIWALIYLPLCWKTAMWSIIYYFCTGFGITAGYHRLWSHRGYNASWIVRFWLMLFGSGAVQGSIRWWCRNHRIHHRYTDTALDPYNAQQGFFYSHFGWMLLTKDYSKIQTTAKFDISDLESDPMVMWQNKYYGFVSLFMAFVFPSLVAGFGWGDWMGGYFFAGVARLVFVHHATFCVNSLAHWYGQQPFAQDHTPRDHFTTAIVTLGEGYHNFHHEFPQDYRNAIKWWQYDPTKWLINTLWFFGLAFDLKQFSENEIRMGQWQMKQKMIDEQSSNIDWPVEPAKLPSMDPNEFNNRISKGEKLIIIDNIVHDITSWINDNPCGSELQNWIGKDATIQFNGTVYRHSEGAKRMLGSYRIANLGGKNHKKSTILTSS